MHTFTAEVTPVLVTGITRGWKRDWDVRWTSEEWARLRKELWRVTAPGGHVLVFSQGDFTEDVRKQFSERGVSFQSLVWIHNDLSGPAWNQSYLAHHECAPVSTAHGFTQ